jgi:hypothetical protein
MLFLGYTAYQIGLAQMPRPFTRLRVGFVLRISLPSTPYSLFLSFFALHILAVMDPYEEENGVFQ